LGTLSFSNASDLGYNSLFFPCRFGWAFLPTPPPFLPSFPKILVPSISDQLCCSSRPQRVPERLLFPIPLSTFPSKPGLRVCPCSQIKTPLRSWEPFHLPIPQEVPPAPPMKTNSPSPNSSSWQPPDSVPVGEDQEISQKESAARPIRNPRSVLRTPLLLGVDSIPG